jgi:hypothetical protein
LVKQEQKNKFATHFKPTPHTVVGKNGSEVMVRSPEGSCILRNSNCFKKYETDTNIQIPTTEETGLNPREVTLAQPAPEGNGNPPQAEHPQRQQRNRRLPERYKDFVMT